MKYSRKIKRLLRQYMTEAYERELQRELTKLDEGFAQWRAGAISGGELSERVHRYKRGPSRERYKRYNQGEANLNVAHALVVGKLGENEVPAELITALAGPIELFQSMRERGDLREVD